MKFRVDISLVYLICGVNSSLATCYVKAGYGERCFKQLHRRIRKHATRVKIVDHFDPDANTSAKNSDHLLLITEN